MPNNLCEASPQPGWLVEAWRLHGVREQAGSRDHADIMALYRDVGHPGIKHDETPWCAAFVGACLERTGVKSTRSLMARSYSQWGQRLAAGRPGAIAVLTRGGDPVYGHVGFWMGETTDKVFLLGGNQRNQVTVAAFDKRRLIDVRWPDADTSIGVTRDGGSYAPDFQRALAHVLEMEGGYTDDPYDPGGPTNYGITLKVFANWRQVRLTGANKAALKAQLKRIAKDDVASIYETKYWRRAHCHEFAPGLSLMHFDCAVNQGVGRAVRFLQQAVGAGVDGEIGPLTRAAARRQSVHKTLEAYAALRRAHYRSLHHFWRFGRGWLRRVTRTLALSMRIADETQTGATTEGCLSHHDHVSETQPEKEADMPTNSNTQSKAKWWGSSMTIWGVLVTTLSTVLPTLGPAIGVDITPDLVKDAGGQLVTTVQAISALIGTLMTIYGRARASKPLQLRDVTLRL